VKSRVEDRRHHGDSANYPIIPDRAFFLMAAGDAN
jgi:hypothetical protein